MSLDRYEPLFFNANFKEAASDASLVAYRGELILQETGTSLSTMCEGEQLRAVEVYEADGEIGFADFRVASVSA